MCPPPPTGRYIVLMHPLEPSGGGVATAHSGLSRGWSALQLRGLSVRGGRTSGMASGAPLLAGVVSAGRSCAENRAADSASSWGAARPRPDLTCYELVSHAVVTATNKK
jgi:hypothetical protein